MIMPPVPSLHASGAKPEAPSAQAGSPVPSARLKDAAHRFEASLMQELMEPMQRDPLGEEEDGHDASADALGSFSREAMARALSDRGGFGIADRIIHSLEHSRSDPPPNP